MLGFEQLVNQLQRTGHRRLVVLSGDEAWTLSQATHLRDTLPGDWLWLEENPSKAISGLLGREYLHAVFDARDGFDVSAFAALSGTLRAGSLLVLLVPPFSVWADRRQGFSALERQRRADRHPALCSPLLPDACRRFRCHRLASTSSSVPSRCARFTRLAARQR